MSPSSYLEQAYFVHFPPKTVAQGVFSSNAVANLSRARVTYIAKKKRRETRFSHISRDFFQGQPSGDREDDSLLFLWRLLSPGSSPRSLPILPRTMSGGKRKRRRRRRRRNDRGRDRWKKPKRGDFLEEVRDSPVHQMESFYFLIFDASETFIVGSVIFLCRKRDRFVESPSSPSGHTPEKDAPPPPPSFPSFSLSRAVETPFRKGTAKSRKKLTGDRRCRQETLVQKEDFFDWKS